MTISSWKATALTALLATSSIAIVSGQKIIMFPVSAMPPPPPPSSFHNMNMDMGLSRGVMEEPPCRKRRLEPWRHNVRQQCTPEAERLCPEQVSQFLRRQQEQSRLSPFAFVTPSPLAKEIDAFFNELIVSPSDFSIVEGEEKLERQEEDPIDAIFNNMLGFSLRAFDQMMLDATPTSGEAQQTVIGEPAAQEDEGEAEDEASMSADMWVTEEEDEEEDVLDHMFFGNFEEDEDGGRELDRVMLEGEEGTPISSSFDAEGEDEDESWNEEEVTDWETRESSSSDVAVSATTPEQAAEDALDAMVTTLMRSMLAAPAVEAQDKDRGDIEITLQFLPQRLFQLGNDLLVETQTRRRLTEGDVVNPRSDVQERLARRLTEYRTDLIAYPDGTITLLSANSSPSTTTFVTSSYSSSSMMFGGVPSFLSAPTPLGMGSHDIDECLRSSYNNRDLEGGCHGAVEQLLLAVDHKAAPIGPSNVAVFELPKASGQKAVKNTGVIFLIGFLVVLLSIFLVYDNETVDDEEEEDDAAGLDYAILYDNGDAEEAPGGERGERVFMGIPVQVV